MNTAVLGQQNTEQSKTTTLLEKSHILLNQNDLVQEDINQDSLIDNIQIPLIDQNCEVFKITPCPIIIGVILNQRGLQSVKDQLKNNPKLSKATLTNQAKKKPQFVVSSKKIPKNSKVNTNNNKTKIPVKVLNSGKILIGMIKNSRKNRQDKIQKKLSQVNLDPFVKSVLKPFDTLPIKPYFDYPLNTSLIEQTLEYQVSATKSDGTLTTPVPFDTYGVAVGIFPHAFNDFGKGLSYFNGEPVEGIQYAPSGYLGNYRFYQQYKSGSGTYSDVIVNDVSPLAIKNSNNSSKTYWGKNNDSTARWTSARVVRCGVRLIPTSAQLNRSGLIQIVQIPGKDLDVNMVGTLGQGSIVIPFPTTSQIKTYPTSYEASNASNNRQHDYCWIPIDPMDAVFVQDQLSDNSASGNIQQVSGDMSTFSNHFRNAIYILATGLAEKDSFRLEIKICYEFVPTTTFRQWTDSTGPRAKLENQQKLKDLVISNPLAQSIQEGCDIGQFLLKSGQSLLETGLKSGLIQELATTAWRGVSATMF